MSALYVVGGQQAAPRALTDDDPQWYAYHQGLVLRVEPETGAVERCLEYVSPPGVRGPDDPVLFKSGTLEGDRLYLCTQTEVLVYQLPTFEQVGYVSLPCFNDVHHVRPTPEGTLLVANSGLEMVLEVTLTGEVRQVWNVLGEDPWEHFDPAVDYRQGVNLKPHRAHPNYLFYVGSELWATRFEQRDAISLTPFGHRLPIGMERAHDGVPHAGRLFFTTVDGHVVVANRNTLAVEETIYLPALHEEEVLLGWCRGLLIEGDTAWVGFSRIRPTRWRGMVSWVRQGFRHSAPTHIARYDLRHKRCLAEIDLEPYGLNAVFTIARHYPPADPHTEP